MAKPVNAIIKGHRVLCYLAEKTQPMKVTEVARDTGISASSCFNILKTLVDLELVSFEASTKEYEFGPEVQRLANMRHSNTSLLTFSRPMLESLSNDYSCQSMLWEFSNNIRKAIAVIDPPTLVKFNFSTGSKIPIGGGSGGRALMAKRNEDLDILKAVFEEVTWQGQMSFEEYQSDIEQASKRGYAIDKGKFFNGVVSISSAIVIDGFDRDYCLTVVMLSSLHPAKKHKEIGERLKEYGQQISETMA